jgi:TldD protein
VKKIAVALLLLASTAHAEKKKPEPKMGGASTAVTTEILDAIAEEMNRSMTSLQIGKNPKPYHISYKITEVDQNNAVASLGYTTEKKNNHFVTIEARVRVGTEDFDNANFVVAGAESLDGVATFPLPLEATPRIAARATWLVTDEAYKEALIQLHAKQDARSTGGGASDAPSWSDVPKGAPDEKPVLVPELEDTDALAKRAEQVSGTFRDDDVRDSRVAFTSYLERRWYISSDGNDSQDTRRVSGVAIVAIGQADDGQDVPAYYTDYGHTAADLPDDAALTKQAEALVKKVGEMQKAPALGKYTGPVLFEDEGATDIVRYSLAPHLGGTPLPEGLRPQDAKEFGGQLAGKLGLKVLAPFLSIVDDPTAEKTAGHALIGGYNMDDEGVAAQKVQVVKAGMLVEFLRSRTPSKKGETSNGHARKVAPGGMFHGTATNLILTAKGGLDRKKLRAKAIAEAKSDGLDYAIVIKHLDDAAITAQPEMTRRELLAMYQNADTDLPPPAIEVYKIYANGKEELVRAAQLGEVDTRVWKDIIAAGKNQTVENFLASGADYIIQKINGTDDGTVPSSGIESSVTAPDLLFKELDLSPYTVGARAKPAVPKPEAEK